MPSSLVWLRNDLRIADNPALTAAAKAGYVVALYVLDDSLPWAMGGASRWWLHYSLEKLRADLGKKNIPLILRKGPAKKLCQKLRGI